MGEGLSCIVGGDDEVLTGERHSKWEMNWGPVVLDIVVGKN